MEYKLYKGYILGWDERFLAQGLYGVEIFLGKLSVEQGNVYHTSGDELSAQSWIDTVDVQVGLATQADVDELNARAHEAYNLTSTGFDVMEVLSVFHKHLGMYGPSPVELELSRKEMKESVIAEHVKDNLPNILQQMVSMGLIYKS